MQWRRVMRRSAILGVALAVGFAGTAAAKSGDSKPRDRGPIAYAACPICVPVGIAALRAAVVAARAARVARAARLMAAASRAFSRAQRVRRAAISKAVRAAKRVSGHGPRWVKRNWNNLPKAAKACLGGGATMLTQDFAKDNKITELEFHSFVLFHYPLADWTEINWNLQFDFSEKKDAIVAACLAGMVGSRFQ